MSYSCCVVNCKNTTTNSSYKFYSFPVAKHKIPQRYLWIIAVRRMNGDGSVWVPTLHDRICCEHFVGGEKSDIEISPSYSPSIFPAVYKMHMINEKTAAERQERYMVRRAMQIANNKKDNPTKQKLKKIIPQPVNCDNDNEFVEEQVQVITSQKSYASKECQVNECQFVEKPSQKIYPDNTFICNRTATVFVDNSTKVLKIFNEAETQTDIVLAKVIVIPSQKQYHSVGCNTTTKVFVDSAVSVNPQPIPVKDRSFKGFSSLKEEKQLLDLSGVNFSTFEFLLERVPPTAENCALSREDRLLLLLMKLKTGLTFSTLSLLFGIHRTTASDIVLSTLQYLASATSNLVFWPSKAEVQGTMPKCFYPDYSQTRVIIDCTEFKVEAPSGVDKRIHCFSWYKKGYTAKLLIGITPGGFICLKSKVAGGHKSDSQITIESGLVDLLEEGDVVLADKGFPEIRKVINDSGKSAFIVMPPFLESNKEFTKKETEDTYKIASVRIHVERVIQRLKIYHILSKIPASLFHYMDDLIHVICVLVNLQPPIYADESKKQPGK